jgi:chemotaxis family two-component system sensor kinase Cph1
MAGQESQPRFTVSHAEPRHGKRAQFSNAVQPHVVLITLDPGSEKILQVSSNVRELTGIEPASLIGRKLSGVVPDPPEITLAELFRDISEHQSPQFLLRCNIGNSACNVFAHKNDGVVQLELEREVAPFFPSVTALYSRLGEAVGQLQQTTSLQEMLSQAVTIIATCTKFERVIAYKYLDDGSGQVVAECVQDGLAKFMGLRYPASNIPASTGGLFLPDVDYQPVPIEPPLNPQTGGNLDLSFALSRSVSVEDTQSLRNMGVKATMVFALSKHGKLWGLISCMNHSASHHVPVESRVVCELFVHSISLILAGKEDAEEFDYVEKLNALEDTLIEKMSRGNAISDSLMAVNWEESLEASGFAVVMDRRILVQGITPSIDQITRLTASLLDKGQDVWSTQQLYSDFPSDPGFAAGASGVLVARISHRSPDFLLWFRGEVENTRPVHALDPWKSEAPGKSRPWRQCEKDFAGNLRRAIVEVILETTRHRETLTEEVYRSHREVEAYLALASHDLKEPLRGIYNYTQFTLRSAKDRLTLQESEWLASVTSLAQRMDLLIESLLGYSRAARSGQYLEEVDFAQQCQEAARRLVKLARERGTKLSIPEQLGTFRSDPGAIQEVFFHLLSNAIIYNDKSDRRVEIGRIPSEIPTFFIRDNGIGIPAESREEVFKLFRRLHTRGEFGEGAGVGLAIARRLIEHLGGKLWIVSVAGEGSTFYFTIGDERA